MSTIALIIFCGLLLIAYLFDLTASKTKIPSVILLLLLGWIVKQLAINFEIVLPDFSTLLPVLGTVGLILIVLEGSLDLELNSSKLSVLKKSLIGSLLPMLFFAFLLGYMFYYFGDGSFKDSLTNAIPFCIISSAIAIPSVRNLAQSHKEFVIYESSLSDIFGVIFFNFIALNEIFDLNSFGHFGLQIVIITVISFIATIILSFFLSKIEHHIKFIPIILLVILIYFISKIFHLPALIFILLFGLSIGNLDELKKYKWIQRFKPDALKHEVEKFKELTVEVAFLIRSVFFLLFGFLIETSEILNTDTLVWSIGIVLAIFGFRTIQLKLSNLPLKPLLYVAPRGLITILLFLSIDPADNINLANKSLIIQVILLTALLMMFGLMTNKKEVEPVLEINILENSEKELQCKEKMVITKI